MGRTCFLKLLLILTFVLNSVMATVYTVGDNEEWSSQTNYASWAERYNFSRGDVLVFKYVKGQHNVYEVTEETFRWCDASSGVLAKYESGEDEVALNQVKSYWFICNIAGHCLGGMRFQIQVKDGNINVTDSTHPPIQPTPSYNSCTSYISQRWTLIKIFIPLALLLFNNYFL